MEDLRATGDAPADHTAAFLADCCRLLHVEAAALVGHSGSDRVFDAAASTDRRVWLSAGAVQDTADRRPDAPLRPVRCGPSDVVALRVRTDPELTTLQLAGGPGWTPDAREAAMMRMLARCAAQELRGSRADGSGWLLERAQWLTDLTGTRDVVAVVGGITAVVASAVGAESLGIAMAGPDRYLRMLPGSFGAGAALTASSQLSPAESHSAAAEAFTHRRTLLVNEPTRDASRFPEWITSYGIRRLMTVPLVLAGKTTGVLHLANKPSDFGPADAQRAETLAPFVSCLIDHVLRQVEVRHRDSMAAVLGRAAFAVAAGRPLGLPLVGEVVGADLVSRLEDIRQELRARTIEVVEGGSVLVTAGQRTAEGPMGQALRDGLRDADTVRSTVVRPAAPGEPGFTTLYVPISVEGAGDLQIAVLRTPCEPFRGYERTAVVQLSNLLALAWTRDRSMRRKEELTRLRERERIADDIHDHVAQTLFGARIGLESVLDGSFGDVGPGIEPHVTRALRGLVRGEASLRDAIHGLAGPTVGAATFVDQLVDVVHGVEEQFATGVELDVDPADVVSFGQVEDHVAGTVLVVVRESLVNAAKHAGASRVAVAVATDGAAITVTVGDDGCGFDPHPGAGHGMRALRRTVAACGGSLTWESSVGRGTTVVMRVPRTVASASGRGPGS